MEKKNGRTKLRKLIVEMKPVEAAGRMGQESSFAAMAGSAPSLVELLDPSFPAVPLPRLRPVSEHQAATRRAFGLAAEMEPTLEDATVIGRADVPPAVD